MLRRCGPEVAEPKRDGEDTLGCMLVTMLNQLVVFAVSECWDAVGYAQ
jgi:hypothetical protein